MSNRTRWWYVTMWDINYDFGSLIGKGQFRFARVGGVEKTKTGKEHRHVLLYSINPKPDTRTGRGWIAKQMGCKIHPDVKGALGNEEQCTAYGSKDNDYQDFGDKPKQGMRSDLEAIKDDILNGTTTVDDIAIEQPNMYHQYGRTFNKLEDIALRRKFRTWMTTCEWIYGKTGVGKSHKAFENYNPDTHYIYPNDNGWWDGYTGQETVIINEFRGGIQYSELLDLIDKWPKTVKRRHREPAPFLAKHIIITSSMTPSEVYNNLSINDRLEQLMRRITLTHLKRTEVV